MQENGGNKEDDGADEVDGNNITCRLEDQVQQPPDDFTISMDPELSQTTSGKLLFLKVLRLCRTGCLNNHPLCGTSVLEV